MLRRAVLRAASTARASAAGPEAGLQNLSASHLFSSGMSDEAGASTSARTSSPQGRLVVITLAETPLDAAPNHVRRCFHGR